MATIFYSMMGEGRGHAARARAMIERLRDRHRMVLFTSHDALAFLRSHYDGDDAVVIHEIPGLVFHYANERIALGKTIGAGLSLWVSLHRHVRALEPYFDRESPDLVVTDFEPLLPRAARRKGAPVMSLDHQHFMTTYDLSSLPPRLRRWAWAMSWSVWGFGIRAEKTVVSAFYKPPLRPGCENVEQVGPLLRPAVLKHQPTVGGHALSYCRRATPQRVVDLLAESPIPVKLYGLGERPPQGAIRFCAIDEDAFVVDLAHADCVVAAAGNQLLGESLYFRKPVLALPERNHHEQCINACFLESLGGGEQRYLEEVAANDLRGFFERRETYRENLQTGAEPFDGTAHAAAAIEGMLRQT